MFITRSGPHAGLMFHPTQLKDTIMYDANDDGTTSYDNGDTTTTYGTGYDNPDTESTYQTDTAAEDGLYQASTDAYVAGDTYGSEQLNDASIEAAGDANTAWQEYNGTGEYAGTETYDTPATTDDAGSYDAGATDSGSYDPGSYEAPATDDTGSYDAGATDTGSYESSDAGSDTANAYADYAGS